MPIYKYVCYKCGHEAEEIRGSDFRDDPSNCPACKAFQTMQRELSVFGTYSIKGNNSASVTPKKHRGGRKDG